MNLIFRLSIQEEVTDELMSAFFLFQFVTLDLDLQQGYYLKLQ